MTFDWDLAVLVLFIATTIIGFTWRRTRNQLFYYAWLVALYVEQQARKVRDKKGEKRSV